MIARNKKPPPVQLRGQCNALLDRAEREVAEVQHDVIGADEVVPSFDHDRVHLVDRCERPTSEFADPRVPEVVIARHEVNDVETEVVCIWRLHLCSPLMSREDQLAR
ncbi:MAG: hypothetical protein QM626_02650 [Microbacterium sp.]